MIRYIILLHLLILQAVLIGQTEARESGGSPITITEFNYNSDTYNNSGDWIELHNSGATTVDLSGWQIKDLFGATFTMPGGISLPANEYLVVVEDPDTFQMIYPDVDNFIGNLPFSLGNENGSIRLYDDAGGLLRQLSYIDSFPWPRCGDGYGATLQILDENASEISATNWYCGCALGTPGSGYSNCDYDLVVSEINYNSLPAYNPGDWIELYNRGSGTITLGNWTLRDSRNDHAFLIPSGTSLSPGSRLVISDSLISFTEKFPTVTNVIGEPAFGFANGGDAIRLYDNTSKIRYTVRYNDESPWPNDPDGDGFTLELTDEGGNPNFSTSWASGCLFGSPGTLFVLPCPTGISTYETSGLIAGPVPFSDHLHLELQSGLMIKMLEVYNAQGICVYQSAIAQYRFDWNGADQSGSGLPAGFYIVRVLTQDNQTATLHVVKSN